MSIQYRYLGWRGQWDILTTHIHKNVISRLRQERPLDLHGHETNYIPQQESLCLLMYNLYAEVTVSFKCLL